MFPLKDTIPTLRFPLVTVVLIAINVVVFGYQLWHPPEQLRAVHTTQVYAVSGADAFTAEWGFRPCELARHCVNPPVTLPLAGDSSLAIRARVQQHPAWLTLLTSMFLHGGWLHIAGNMLFLWIFGANVEDSMGRFRYLLFYLVCGVLAGLAQLWTDPASAVPNIGASGAIAGVLGGYLLLYPRARVLTGVFLVFIFTLVEVPAFVLLGAWFLLQLWDGAGSVGGGGGGIAYFAHIGGFVAGLVLIHFFATHRKQPTLTGRY